MYLTSGTADATRVLTTQSRCMGWVSHHNSVVTYLCCCSLPIIAMVRRMERVNKQLDTTAIYLQYNTSWWLCYNTSWWLCYNTSWWLCYNTSWWLCYNTSWWLCYNTSWWLCYNTSWWLCYFEPDRYHYCKCSFHTISHGARRSHLTVGK